MHLICSMIILFHLSAHLVSGHPCSTSALQCRDDDGELRCEFQTSDTAVIGTSITECSREANNFMSKSFYTIFFIISQPISGGNISLDINDNLTTIRIVYNGNRTFSGCLNVIWSRVHPNIVDIGLTCIVMNPNFLNYIPNLELLAMEFTQFNDFFLFKTQNNIEQIYCYDILVPSPVLLNSSMMFPRLDTLVLSEFSCHWFSLSPDTFYSFQDLKYLYVGKFQDRLYTNQFSMLTRLEYLTILFNQSTVIEDDAFAGLNTVKNLYFEYPFELERLRNTTFQNLNLISFTNCGFTKLDYAFFQQQQRLRTILAPRQNFHCDCDLQWTSIVSNSFDLTISGVCSTPIELKGNQIANISNYLNCTPTQSFQCFNKSFTCPDFSACVNTVDSAYCDCDEGRQMFENECILVIDCAVNNGGCDQLCYITNGIHHCACAQGYSLIPGEDRNSCDDINECISPMPCGHLCTNTHGSYICSCRLGYVLTDTSGCADIDECVTNNGGCSQICNNVIGSYDCDCMAGFKVGTDLFSCTDINECLIDNHTCQEECVNNLGSYTCQSANSAKHSTLISLIVVVSALFIASSLIIVFIICFCLYRKKTRSLQLQKTKEPSFSLLSAANCEDDDSGTSNLIN